MKIIRLISTFLAIYFVFNYDSNGIFILELVRFISLVGLLIVLTSEMPPFDKPKKTKADNKQKAEKPNATS